MSGPITHLDQSCTNTAAAVSYNSQAAPFYAVPNMNPYAAKRDSRDSRNSACSASSISTRSSAVSRSSLTSHPSITESDSSTRTSASLNAVSPIPSFDSPVVGSPPDRYVFSPLYSEDREYLAKTKSRRAPSSLSDISYSYGRHPSDFKVSPLEQTFSSDGRDPDPSVPVNGSGAIGVDPVGFSGAAQCDSPGTASSGTVSVGTVLAGSSGNAADVLPGELGPQQSFGYPYYTPYSTNHYQSSYAGNVNGYSPNQPIGTQQQMMLPYESLAGSGPCVGASPYGQVPFPAHQPASGQPGLVGFTTLAPPNTGIHPGDGQLVAGGIKQGDDALEVHESVEPITIQQYAPQEHRHLQHFDPLDLG